MQRRRISNMTRLSAYLILAGLATLPSHAQIVPGTTGQVSISEPHFGENITIGKRSKFLVDPQKAKAIVMEVDVEARTITVAPEKRNGTFRVADLTR